jgi:MOSC domain-containing protein YiiM
MIFLYKCDNIRVISLLKEGRSIRAGLKSGAVDGDEGHDVGYHGGWNRQSFWGWNQAA